MSLHFTLYHAIFRSTVLCVVIFNYVLLCLAMFHAMFCYILLCFLLCLAMVLLCSAQQTAILPIHEEHFLLLIADF